MKKIKKLVAVTGKYQKDGVEKNSYMTVGGLFQRDDGSFCIKLDALPLGEFNGWLNAYDLEENRQQNSQQGMQQAKAAASPDDFQDSDIPFN